MNFLLFQKILNMKSIHLLFLAAILMFVSNLTAKAQEKQNRANEQEAIRKVLENYRLSINRADTGLTGPEATFIHPRGHEKGWEEIKSGIYEMFGSRFTKRDLKSYNESVQLYGHMAILEFYWVFDATRSGEKPSQMQSRGRETQVLKKTGNDWKIVHVHYSGMHKTGEREGF